MVSHRWQYSRKKPGFDAYGGFRMIRQLMPPVVAKGQLISETPASWRVQLDQDPQHLHRFISKRYATRDAEAGTWTIPAWLWSRMMGGDDLK